MRLPFRALLALAVLLIAVTACTSGRVSRLPANTPVPTKTLRPTFTNTPAKPTLTPSPTPAPATPTPEAPTPTPEPPTPAPTETPKNATFTVASTTVNVRAGPGTNYNAIGQLRQGQTLTITGKNPTGDWWQFNFNGRQGWVFGNNVRVTNAELVQVATNIPAAPVARPAATRAPQPAAPTAPPARPATQFSIISTTITNNENDYITVYCLKLNKGQTAAVAGAMRLSRDGNVLATKSFPAQASWFLQFPVSDGCKIEIQPAVNGTYVVDLFENGQQVADPFSFSVTGPANRTVIIGWKEK